MGAQRNDVSGRVNILTKFPKAPYGYEYYGSNLIHKTAEINWDKVELGSGNKVGPYCVLGGDAEHKFYPSNGKIRIGNNNVFYSSVTVSLPTQLSKITTIYDRCVFMSSSIIHHDCLIEDDVTISSNVSVGGNVIVMQGANIGMNAAIHQFTVVGAFSMLGMASCVTKQSVVVPGQKFVGVPVRDIGPNDVGLSRAAVTEGDLNFEIERYKILNQNLQKMMCSAR